jgi:hypothetical protein
LRKIGIGLLAVLFFQACQFELEETFFVDVQPPPDTPAINVYITNPDFEDPYFLEQNTTFKIRLEAPVNQFLGGMVTVDDQSVSISSDANGDQQFILSPYQYQTGSHTVIVHFEFRTHSGSLADQLLAERYIFEQEFQIIVDHEAPVLKSPITAAMEGGYLTLRWSVTDDKPRNYEIVKDQLNDPFDNVLARTRIRNAGEVIYIDSGFVGNPTTYTVQGLTFGNYNYLGRVEVTIQPTTFTLVRSETGGNSILEWTSTLKNANITVVAPSVTKTLSINEGSVTLDTLLLGAMSPYIVMINRNDHPSQYHRQYINVNTGDNLPQFYDVESVDQNTFIIASHTYLKKYGYSNLKALDSISQQYPLTDINRAYNGQTMTAYSANSQSGPWRFTPASLGAPTFFPLSVQVLDDNYRVWGNKTSPVSANGFTGINFPLNDLPWAAIVDFNADIQNTPSSSIAWYDSANVDTPTLSPDGLYFCLNTRDQANARVFKKIAADWIQVGMIPAGSRHFRGGSSNEVIVFSTSGIQIIDVTAEPANSTATYNALRTFAYPGVAAGQQRVAVGFDHVTQYIFIQTMGAGYKSTIRTYDVVNFNKQEIASAYVPPMEYPIKHFYTNHHHFLSNGYVEKIK